MGDRRRSRPHAVWPALAAIAAFAIAVGVVVWWILIQSGPEPTEPPPYRIEAEGPPDEPIRVPRASAPPTEVKVVGVAAVEARTAAALAEPLPTAPLEGPVRIDATAVRWDAPGGRPFFYGDSVSGVLDAGELNRGGGLVTELTLTRPRVVIERAAGVDAWNYEQAFDRLTRRGDGDAPPTGPSPPPPPVQFLDVTVLAGSAVVNMPGVDTLRFTEIDAVLPRVDVSVPGEPITAVVARVAMAAELPEPVGARAVTSSDAVFRWPDGRVQFEVSRLTIDSTIVAEIVAEYFPDAAGLGLAGTARVERLPFADALSIVPDPPPEGVASFDLAIEPGPEGASGIAITGLSATAGESRATGSLAVSLGAEGGARLLSADLSFDPLTLALLERFVGPLPYTGELRGRIQGTAPTFGFELTARLATAAVPEPFLARVSGSLTFGEEGFALRGADIGLEDVPLAALRPVTGPLPLALDARLSGRILLRGPPGDAPLTLDVSLALEAGTILLTGTVDLSGPVVAYDLEGRVVGLALDALLEPEVPPVTLTARFEIDGRGTDPATADARLALRGAFTGWQTGPADTVVAVASVREGTLTVDAAALRLATLDLAVNGAWRFVEPGAGGLEYVIEFASLEPFAPYLPALRPGETARGALRAEGTLTGTAAAPRLAGNLEGEELEYGDWAAETLLAAFDVTFGGALPVARIEAAASDVRAPGGAVYDTATASFVLEEPRFALDVVAERAEGGMVELSSDGVVAANGAVDAVVRRLNVDLDGERWSLARPARVAWAPETGFDIRALELREEGGEGRIVAEGRLPPTATASLRVDIAALPIGRVLELLGREPVVSGEVWAQARATGPADDPSIRVDFRLEGGRIQEVYATRIVGSLLYEDTRLLAEAVAVLDTFGVLNLDASLPLSLDLAAISEARLIEGAPIRAALRADSLPLEAVTLLTREVRDATGLLRAHIVVTGTAGAPRLDGALQVWNGALTVPALNQRYEEVTADLVLEGQVVRIREARARSDGWAIATGTVAFPSLTDPVVDVTIELDGFRAIGVDDLEDAAAWGRVHIAGELASPTVTGDVTLDDGYVEVPSFGGDDFEAAVAIEGDFAVDGVSPLEPTTALDAPRPLPWFERLALDEFILEAGDNLWFTTEGLRIQLTGELVLVKEAGAEDIRIFGELVGERGTFTLRVGPLVRRFTIVSAEITFFGTLPTNPAISVVAQRTVPSRTGEPIDLQVVVGGTLDAPTVAVTTANGANVPESELLSVLLFGQPSFALADGGAPLTPFVEEALFGVGSLAELASIELEETLIADVGLPLDYFQIRPTTGALGGLGAPTVAFGRELADDVFLTVNVALADVFGSAAGPETWTATIRWRIDPEWSLVLGVAPVHRRRLYSGPFTAVPLVNPEQQFIIELLRRWTY